ncbi:MAG: glycosyltransferase family 2 protein [Pseudomonadota bacterium]
MISVIMLTRNSERHLAQALDSCRPFDQVVMLDNGSTDGTFAIAARYPNVQVERHNGEWPGLGCLLNTAAAFARHDWLLWLDSDEEITPEMAAAIRAQPLDPACVYSFRRVNCFAGRPVHHGGWSNDRIVRLFHRGHGRFSEDRAHPRVIAPGTREVARPEILLHYSYDTVDDFMRKAIWFSDRFVEQHRGRRRATVPQAVLHGAAAFLKTYVLRAGFLDGYVGLLIAVSNAYGTLYKYLKLREANRSQS